MAVCEATGCPNNAHPNSLFCGKHRSLSPFGAMTPPTPEAREPGREEPSVIYATVRESGDDEWDDIECRFSDGQKFTAARVDATMPGLAQRIARALTLPTGEARAGEAEPCYECGGSGIGGRSGRVCGDCNGSGRAPAPVVRGAEVVAWLCEVNRNGRWARVGEPAPDRRLLCEYEDAARATGMEVRIVPLYTSPPVVRDEAWKREYERLRDALVKAESDLAHAHVRAKESGGTEMWENAASLFRAARAALDAHVLGEEEGG